MNENPQWSRRKFSKAVLSLQALVTAGILNVNLGCASEEKKPVEALLGETALQRLQLAMDEIIPASGKMPAASEVDSINYILKVLKGYPELSDPFDKILVTLNELSVATKNEDFENLKSTSRISVLQKFEKEQREMFTVLQNFVYEAYYINERVWKLIGYEPYPTMAAGPEMEPFDEAMLDRVKQMTSLYIKV